MKRRTFLKSSIVAAGLAGVRAASSAVAADATSKPMREFYELRLYHLRKGPKQKLFDDFFRDASIPAMNRNGIPAVGVFTVAVGPDNPTMYVLLPYKTMEEFGTSLSRIRADADYQKLGADFINATAADPAYTRVESQLMVAFEGMPKLEIPAAAKGNQPRIFELRTYESHSKKASQKKAEMFNNGEIAIFRKNGLQPVFFGETMIGSKMPNVTYMLTFENMAARDKNWSAFAADPDWKKLSTTPGYTDPEIVSNISNLFLRPTPYSQI